jgi:sec-independent protein translocase protein TatA
MGVGGIGIWQLLIILVIVLLLFGTKRLRSLGSDLGGAIKGFRGAMKDGQKEQEDKPAEQLAQDGKRDTVIDAQAVREDETKKPG